MEDDLARDTLDERMDPTGFGNSRPRWKNVTAVSPGPSAYKPRSVG